MENTQTVRLMGLIPKGKEEHFILEDSSINITEAEVVIPCFSFRGEEGDFDSHEADKKCSMIVADVARARINNYKNYNEATVHHSELFELLGKINNLKRLLVKRPPTGVMLIHDLTDEVHCIMGPIYKSELVNAQEVIARVT